MLAFVQDVMGDWLPVQVLDFIGDHRSLYYMAGFVLFWAVLEGISSCRDERKKRICVTVLGASFFVFLDPISFCLLTGFAVAVFAMVRMKVRLTRYLYYIVFGLIGVLVCIKDHSLFFGMDSPYLPLGVSYYFFRLISFIIDYQTKPARFEAMSFWEFFSWVYFFPVFLAGPILRFCDFSLLSQDVVAKDKLKAYCLFWGALIAKLYVVDYYLFNKAYVVLLASIDQTGSFWVLSKFGMYAFLHGYLDLMLYTEMSKSVAKYMGFTNVDNFQRPLLATNISQFWQRWHLSLSNWTRDYVFFPTLVKTRKVWLANYTSLMTIGIWHSISVNWLLWAFLHGTALNIYSSWRGSSLFAKISSWEPGRKVLLLLGWAITLYYVSIIYVFVAFRDYSIPFKLFAQCLGLR